MSRLGLHTTWHEVVTDDDAFAVRVSYTARPGTPDTWDEPGDGPEFEIVKAEVADGAGWLAFTLSSADEALVLAHLAEDHDFTPEGPDPDDVYDRRRDDAMMGIGP